MHSLFSLCLLNGLPIPPSLIWWRGQFMKLLTTHFLLLHRLRVKVKLSPGLINYTMKTYGDWRYICTILCLGTRRRRPIAISVTFIIQINSWNVGIRATLTAYEPEAANYHKASISRILDTSWAPTQNLLQMCISRTISSIAWRLHLLTICHFSQEPYWTLRTWCASKSQYHRRVSTYQTLVIPGNSGDGTA